jgi:hypothetical protein
LRRSGRPDRRCLVFLASRLVPDLVRVPGQDARVLHPRESVRIDGRLRRIVHDRERLLQGGRGVHQRHLLRERHMRNRRDTKGVPGPRADRALSSSRSRPFAANEGTEALPNGLTARERATV